MIPKLTNYKLRVDYI